MAYESGKIFIYGLVCPLENITRYVGKSCRPKERFYQHLYCSNKKRYRKTYLHGWLKKLHALGLLPTLKIIEEVNQENWQMKEKFWIAHFGLENLCNITSGGNGSSTTIAPKEKVNLYLTDRQLEILRRMSSEMGLPLAEIVRRALDEYLEGKS